MTDPRFTEGMVEAFREAAAQRRRYTSYEAWLLFDEDGALEADLDIRSILTALTETSVILPREPTDAMIEAAHTGIDSAGYGISHGDAIQVYRAMRDAALGGKG
jgi:hypothetical protein